MKRCLFLLLAVGVWTGCSNTLEVVMVGQSEMNSGGNPAVVKVYQLQGEGNFESTPLSAFWRDDRGALGSELVTAPSKVTVYPDESKETIEFELAEETKYIGVAANLRKPEREGWRSVHPVEGMGDRIWVTVKTSQVEVEVEESRIPDVGIGDQRPAGRDSLPLFTLLNDVPAHGEGR